MAFLHSTWFFTKGCVKTYLLKLPPPQPPPTHDSDVKKGFPPRLAGVRGLFWGWLHSASLNKDPKLGVNPVIFPHRSGRVSGVDFFVVVKTT